MASGPTQNGKPHCVIRLVPGVPRLGEQIVGTLPLFRQPLSTVRAPLLALWSLVPLQGPLSAGPGMGLLAQEVHPFPSPFLSSQ